MLNINVDFGTLTASVVFAGQAPTLIAGVTQVNAQIPPNAPTGPSVPLTIAAGVYFSSATGMESEVFVAVQ